MLIKFLALSFVSLFYLCSAIAEKPVIGYPEIRLADIEKVREKINQGAELNIFDSSDISPLFLTALLGEIEVAKVLVENGADVNLVRSDGATPIFLSLNGEMIDFLVSQGANINHSTPYGFTPLTSAIYYQKYRIAEHLVKIGADVNVLKLEGRSPLNILNERKDTPLGNREKDLRNLIIAAGGVDIASPNKKEGTQKVISRQSRDNCDRSEVRKHQGSLNLYGDCEKLSK